MSAFLFFDDRDDKKIRTPRNERHNRLRRPHHKPWYGGRCSRCDI